MFDRSKNERLRRRWRRHCSSCARLRKLPGAALCTSGGAPPCTPNQAPTSSPGWCVRYALSLKSPLILHTLLFSLILPIRHRGMHASSLAANYNFTDKNAASCRGFTTTCQSAGEHLHGGWQAHRNMLSAQSVLTSAGMVWNSCWSMAMASWQW